MREEVKLDLALKYKGKVTQADMGESNTFQEMGVVPHILNIGACKGLWGNKCNPDHKEPSLRIDFLS